MSANDDDTADDGVEAELERTIAEAEAAVDAVQHESDRESSAEEGSSEAEQIDQLRGEVETLRDRWLRAVADLDNYKKRTRREVEEAVVRRTQELLQGFLPTVDNLERALDVAASPSTGVDDLRGQLEQLVKGLHMVRDEFIAALGRFGISPVATVGHVFDPTVHDALQQIDSPDHAPGVVIREFEKGYRQGDRLLRPARVIVAGPGSTGKRERGSEEH